MTAAAAAGPGGPGHESRSLIPAMRPRISPPRRGGSCGHGGRSLTEPGWARPAGGATVTLAGCLTVTQSLRVRRTLPASAGPVSPSLTESLSPGDGLPVTVSGSDSEAKPGTPPGGCAGPA